MDPDIESYNGDQLKGLKQVMSVLNKITITLKIYYNHSGQRMALVEYFGIINK